MKRLIKAACACLVLAGLSACALLPAEEVRREAPLIYETESEEFKVSYVTRGDMALTQKVTCTYVPIQQVNVYFSVSGEYVDEIYVKAGDSVKKGELLGQLRLDGVEDSIDSLKKQIALSRLNLAHIEEDRQLQLERQRILYASDAEQLQKALDSVNAACDRSVQSINDSLYIMEMQLDQLYESRTLRQLIAPIDGTVTYVRKYPEGKVSNETEKALTIVDSTMSLFTANTEHWDRFSVGDIVTITVKKVEYEAEVADPASLGLQPPERVPGKRGTVYFTLLTPSFTLEDNDRGTLELTLDSRENVLKVSQDAISAANGQNIVYVRDKDGMKTYKNVVVGLNANKFYEVIEGLIEGEEVIVE